MARNFHNKSDKEPALIEDLKKAYCCAKIKTAAVNDQGELVFTFENTQTVTTDLSAVPDYADNATAFAAIGADKLFKITSTGVLHISFDPS